MRWSWFGRSPVPLAAPLAEIGWSWLLGRVRGTAACGWPGGVRAAAYGFAATLQPNAHFGRILAAYGGVFVAGSLAWGMVVDGFRPDRLDYLGAAVCLAGVALIMYVPR